MISIAGANKNPSRIAPASWICLLISPDVFPSGIPKRRPSRPLACAASHSSASRRFAKALDFQRVGLRAVCRCDQRIECVMCCRKPCRSFRIEAGLFQLVRFEYLSKTAYVPPITIPYIETITSEKALAPKPALVLMAK
jgi:hypothetical protein